MLILFVLSSAFCWHLSFARQVPAGHVRMVPGHEWRTAACFMLRQDCPLYPGCVRAVSTLIYQTTWSKVVLHHHFHRKDTFYIEVTSTTVLKQWATYKPTSRKYKSRKKSLRFMALFLTHTMALEAPNKENVHFQLSSSLQNRPGPSLPCNHGAITSWTWVHTVTLTAPPISIFWTKWSTTASRSANSWTRSHSPILQHPRFLLYNSAFYQWYDITNFQ